MKGFESQYNKRPKSWENQFSCLFSSEEEQGYFEQAIKTTNELYGLMPDVVCRVRRGEILSPADEEQYWQWMCYIHEYWKAVPLDFVLVKR